MKSYAQDKEDIILAEMLKDVKKGFYVDVGANSPTIFSVTKAFYEMGWSGINIEPLPDKYTELCADRDRDINLNIGIGNAKGTMTLYIEGMCSTMSDRVVADNGLQNKPTMQIEVDTLTNVISKFAPLEIHFLKVDVEGFERQVLEGYDFRVRPWVICMESTKPNTEIPCYEEWEHILIDHGYALEKAHGINRFYVDTWRSWE